LAAVPEPETDETGGPADAPAADPGVTAFDGGEADATMPEIAVPGPNSGATFAKDAQLPDAPALETTGPEMAPPQLAVPPVAAPDDLIRQLVMFALLLAMLSAVTLLLWRYHRRDYASPRRTRRRI
jgi:hypothetical protein